jgi:aspartate/methionine/tyrosine aminotransferase
VFSKRTNWKLEPNRFTRAVEAHRAAGRELLDLTPSNPTQCGFHYDDAAILGALAQPGAMEYRPEALGLCAAREAVAAYYAERGVEVLPDRIVLATSTSEAYTFVFRLLCEAGDEVLGPAPSYPLFQFLADIQDVRLGQYPLFYNHGWHVDTAALRAAGERARAIVVVNPNNPTGSYVHEEERAALAQSCAQRGMALVADEVFLDFALDDVARGSFASERRALTFTLSGLSKIAALPQMKAAWMVVSGPEEPVREAMARLEVIADTYLSLSTPIQLALPALLEQRRRMQPQVMERVRGNLRVLDAALAGQSSCSRLEVEGGWYAVLRVPATRSDEDWAIGLLVERGVLVHPGHFYDFRGEGYLVVSLITPVAEFRKGVERVVEQLG